MVAADQGRICNAKEYLVMMCAMLICDIPRWLVQDRRYILDMRVNSGFRYIKGADCQLTFRLYRVVTLVARTPFLMLLVARWFKTVWLG